MPFESFTRPRSLRRNTRICWRNAAFSASSTDLDRNGMARSANSRRISAIIAADAIRIRHRARSDDIFGIEQVSLDPISATYSERLLAWSAMQESIAAAKLKPGDIEELELDF